MSQLVEMPFKCGDGEALMTYAYGESSPAERDAIAAHVARCESCAEEVAAIGATREQLAAWTPPPQTLGFQITRNEERRSGVPAGATERGGAADEPVVPATILRPAAWWNRPLPAWAQMAAAVVIFASGLAIGMSRGTSPAATVARDGAVTPAAGASLAQTSVTRDELARVEQRLRGEIAQVRTAAPATESSAVVMQRVSQMIAASEGRQRQQLEDRTAQLATDFWNRRTTDMVNIEKRLGVTTTKVLGNQQVINSLAQRVLYTPAQPYEP